jgi:hypothetical protein
MSGRVGVARRRALYERQTYLLEHDPDNKTNQSLWQLDMPWQITSTTHSRFCFVFSQSSALIYIMTRSEIVIEPKLDLVGFCRDPTLGKLCMKRLHLPCTR